MMKHLNLQNTSDILMDMKNHYERKLNLDCKKLIEEWAGNY
jgi:hypothetical protein